MIEMWDWLWNNVIGPGLATGLVMFFLLCFVINIPTK